jgi:hypothetical protein
MESSGAPDSYQADKIRLQPNASRENKTPHYQQNAQNNQSMRKLVEMKQVDSPLP